MRRMSDSRRPRWVISAVAAVAAVIMCSAAVAAPRPSAWQWTPAQASAKATAAAFEKASCKPIGKPAVKGRWVRFSCSASTGPLWLVERKAGTACVSLSGPAAPACMAAKDLVPFASVIRPDDWQSGVRGAISMAVLGRSSFFFPLASIRCVGVDGYSACVFTGDVAGSASIFQRAKVRPVVVLGPLTCSGDYVGKPGCG